jgi:hypothetical protein
VSQPLLLKVYSLEALFVKTRFSALPFRKKPKKWGKKVFWVFLSVYWGLGAKRLQ